MIIHVRLIPGIPGGGDPEKQRVEAVVEVAVVSVAGGTESVAGEGGAEAAGGEAPGGGPADAEEETTDPCCCRPKSRKVVTLVPTRRRRKWESISLMVTLASRCF